MIQTAELSQEQIDFLNSYDIDLDGSQLIEGKLLHQYMICNDAYTDFYDHLIFIDDQNGGNHSSQEQFLYYMGAENEATLLARHLGITIYEGISDERLERYREQETPDE